MQKANAGMLLYLKADNQTERIIKLLRERERLIKKFALMLSETDELLKTVLGNDTHQFKPRCRNSETLSRFILKAMNQSTMKSLSETEIADRVLSMGYNTNAKDFVNSIHIVMVMLARDGLVNCSVQDVRHWSLMQCGMQSVSSSIDE
tara:strand:- start:32837 stop:33280 length:444 start_codon:yes stop_codon:yes gene_type:complete